MALKRSGKRLWVLALVAVLVLALPLAVGAQTGTTGAAQAQTNGITSPRDMAALSGTVTVTGFASHPNFMKWQLDLLPAGDSNQAIFLTLGETQGVFTYTLNTTNLPAGEHALRLRVVRQDSNYDEYTTRFTIGQASGGTATATATSVSATATVTATATTTPAPTATPAPAAGATGTAGVSTNGLAAPTEGQNISGQFVVRGFASDPSFLKWQLDLLPAGNQNAGIFLALGETPGVFTYTLNTTNLPAGQHALRLRVVRQDSNYSEYITNFSLGGAATGTTGGGAATATATPAATSAATATATPAATSTGTGSGAAGTTTNGISAPAEGATVRGSVAVTGFANTANFLKWQLDLLPSGNQNAGIFLALGETPGAFTYTLDTANLPAGEHALRLRVVRSDSNYDEFITRFTIAK